MSTTTKVVAALQFLAMSAAERAKHVPVEPDDVVYRQSDEDGNIVEFTRPAEVAIRTCFRIFTDFNIQGPWTDNVDLAKLLQELQLLFDMMLCLTEQASYFWLLDKEVYYFSGPWDRIWEVLRRLAVLALDEVKELATPLLPYREFIDLGGFSRATGFLPEA